MSRTHFDSALVVAALVAVLLPADSQSSQIMFERTYGGTADDFGYSVQQTTDGGYIVTGETQSFGAGGADAYLVRTDPHGDTLWTRTFGGPLNEDGTSVRQTTDGGYVVAGNAPDGAWLIKTDSSGGTMWTRVYAGQNVAKMVEQTADGGYVIAGYTLSLGAGGEDVWLTKTQSDGDTLWTRVYGGADDDEGWSVQQTTDGGYIIAGVTWSLGAGGQDVWVIKTDSMGDTLWTRTFGGDSIDYGCSAQQTTDGGYFVAGWTLSYSDSPEFYLIKTNANGDTLWTKTIGGPGWAEGFAGDQVEDGGYIIVGICGVGLPDVYLVRTDANGDTLWTRSFGGPDFDMGLRVQQTADGGYVVAGQTYSLGAGLSDFYLIKTDENGNVAVAELKTSQPRKPQLSIACAPNPFSSGTRISLSSQASDSKSVSMRVYDAQGRLVRTLTVNRESSTVWDGRGDAGQLRPSGTYLVRCDVAGTHATTRLVLQR